MFAYLAGGLWISIWALQKWSPKFKRVLFHYNIEMSLCFVTVATSIGTEWLIRVGTSHRQRIRNWFSWALLFGLLGVFLSAVLLVYSMLQQVFLLINPIPEASPVLSLAIPLVTVPWQDLGYLWFSLVVSVGFHEFGHALCAAVWEVRTLRTGAFLITAFPGAYVELDQSSKIGFPSIPVLSRLSIASAGVWHNIVLAGVALGLAQFGSLFALPFYSKLAGPVVIAVRDEMTSLQESLPIGTVIISLDQHVISSADDWAMALSEMMGVETGSKFVNTSSNATEFKMNTDRHGYCLSTSLFNMPTADSGYRMESEDCCDFHLNSWHALQCFRFDQADRPPKCISAKSIKSSLSSAPLCKLRMHSNGFLIL
jgi:hypothetical protein